MRMKDDIDKQYFGLNITINCTVYLFNLKLLHVSLYTYEGEGEHVCVKVK